MVGKEWDCERYDHSRKEVRGYGLVRRVRLKKSVCFLLIRELRLMAFPANKIY